MNAPTIILIGILTSLVAFLLQQIKGSYATACMICGAVFILISALGQVDSIISFVVGLQQKTEVSAEYVDVILKTMGICVFNEFAVSVCNDHHHTTMASALNFFSKTSVVVLALPIFEDILKMLGELLQ